MDDRVPGRPRITASAIADGGGAPVDMRAAAMPDGAAVTDDPLAALRMFGGDQQLPRRTAAPEPRDAVAPAIRDASRARPYVTGRRSVFDDGSSPMVPSLQAPSLPAAGSVPVLSAPTLPSSLPGQPKAPVVPSGGPMLPAAVAPVPMYTPPATDAASLAATSMDARRLKAAQIRHSREQHRGGKLLLKSILAVIMVAAVMGGTVMFGGRYLFPGTWDAALTPIVDEIQQRRGGEFDHVVPLVRQPTAEYAQSVATAMVGTDWAARVPEWRALGLAVGNPTQDSIAVEFGSATRAIYDPSSDRILVAADTDLTQAGAELRIALEAAFDAQHGGDLAVAPGPETPGLLGVSSRAALADRAASTYVGNRVAAANPITIPTVTASTVVTSTTEPASVAPAAPAAPPLPLPLAYELAAVRSLGAPLLTEAGLDAATLTLDAQLPATIGDPLDDHPQAAPPALVLPGDTLVGEPVALGSDDWSLVWGARLPAASVDTLVALVRADSYQVVDRAGVLCVTAVFDTASAGEATFVLAELTNWVAGSAPTAQAAVAPVSETALQLVSCDPGPDAAAAPQRAAVDALITRQVARLSL